VPYLIRPHYVKEMDSGLKEISEKTGYKIRLLPPPLNTQL
jgi:hypothetical protein